MALLKIKDCPADGSTIQPSGCMPFWNESDIVIKQLGISDIRAMPAGFFNPGDATSNQVVRNLGTRNFVYLRVTNNDSADPTPTIGTLQPIKPNVRIVLPSPSIVYPGSWQGAENLTIGPIVPAVASDVDTVNNSSDRNFVDPSSLAQISEEYFAFELTDAQVNAMHAWTTSGSHPCLLAEIVNDAADPIPAGAPAGGNYVTAYRRLAQRNLSVINIPPPPPSPAPDDSDGMPGRDSEHFAFVVGHPDDNDMQAELEVRVTGKTGTSILVLPQKNHFPKLTQNVLGKIEGIRVDKAEQVQGGLLVRSATSTIKFEKQPGKLHPMGLKLNLPQNAKPGDEFRVDVIQKNTDGTVRGGVSALYRVQPASISDVNSGIPPISKWAWLIIILLLFIVVIAYLFV